MFLNSISYFFFSPGVHHFLWDDSCYAERNGFRCPLFVVPPYSWWTPVFLLHVAHCCVHYPMPHSSVYFYQEIEDHQLKNDNQKNKKVLHWGHFVENFSITGHKKQVLYFPLKSTQSLWPICSCSLCFPPAFLLLVFFPHNPRKFRQTAMLDWVWWRLFLKASDVSAVVGDILHAVCKDHCQNTQEFSSSRTIYFFTSAQHIAEIL